MCPYTYYEVMRKSKDPKNLRHQMVVYADGHGTGHATREKQGEAAPVKMLI